MSVETAQTRCSNGADFRQIKELTGAMSMIDTGMESLPMVVIFMQLADAVCAGFETDSPLMELNNLSIGENIATTRRKDIGKRGCG